MALLLAPAVGFLCFYLPILGLGDTAALAVPESLNLVSRVFENVMPVPTALLLALMGFILRYVGGRGTWVLPLLLIAPFPLATLFGVLTNSGSHNLLPIELATQLASVVPALLGTVVASALAKRAPAPQ